MSNLFSSFAPAGILNISVNWLSAAICLSLIPASGLFLKFNRSISLMTMLVKLLSHEFKSIFGVKMYPGTTWFLLTVFLFVFLNNVFGLFPYMFTATSHLVFGFSLALPLWAGHMIYSWKKQPQFALAHLVPKGTPVALMSFMVLIEMVSNVIRPVTLSVRLMANMTAGHLLLTLLSSNVSISSAGSSVVVLSALVLLVGLEVAVSLIQAYVFTLLSSLYLEEVQTKTIME